ncbi:hypothetical protein QTP70_000117 [Hemibagrus guttatus]|uniref:Reverse transcriptase domain-containing protein n=1 Tax=Hemibagrus guttatus TaxID=175788 RepID=A0AAE0V035_9TELE|nr:hypothetical protein QTP70_000117 [Hemibagrus guttatus]
MAVIVNPGLDRSGQGQQGERQKARIHTLTAKILQCGDEPELENYCLIGLRGRSYIMDFSMQARFIRCAIRFSMCSVRIGNSTSSATTLNTGAPQGCVLSPLLFTLLTHDCAAMHSSNHIIKFANDTTMVGLISKNDESAYREEVPRQTAWCEDNNLSLNMEKMKEMVVDFRRTQSDYSPLNINGSNVEIVKSTKFLCVQLAEDLTWSLNTSSITKKSQQRLYFLRRLRTAHLPPLIMTTFYRGTIESILSSCISVWFGNCTASDRKTLQWIVRTAEKIIGVSLPSIMDMYTIHCIHKARIIVNDPTHPSHTLFTLLTSGKRYRSIRALTTRLLNSFLPQAIRNL